MFMVLSVNIDGEVIIIGIRWKLELFSAFFFFNQTESNGNLNVNELRLWKTNPVKMINAPKVTRPMLQWLYDLIPMLVCCYVFATRFQQLSICEFTRKCLNHEIEMKRSNEILIFFIELGGEALSERGRVNKRLKADNSNRKTLFWGANDRKVETPHWSHD